MLTRAWLLWRTVRNLLDPVKVDEVDALRLRLRLEEELQARSIVVAALGETADGGSDEDRDRRMVMVTFRAYRRIYGRHPSQEAVYAALDRLGVGAPERRAVG